MNWYSLITSLVFSAVILYPVLRICRRAGIHWGIAMLTMIPFVGPLVIVVILGFAGWPRDPGARREAEGDH